MAPTSGKRRDQGPRRCARPGTSSSCARRPRGTPAEAVGVFEAAETGRENRHCGIGFHTLPMSTTAGPNGCRPNAPLSSRQRTLPIPSALGANRPLRRLCPQWRGSTSQRKSLGHSICLTKLSHKA